MRALAVLPLLGCLASGCILVYGEAENTGGGGAPAGGGNVVGGGGAGGSLAFQTFAAGACDAPSAVMRASPKLAPVLDLITTSEGTVFVTVDAVYFWQPEKLLPDSWSAPWNASVPPAAAQILGVEEPGGGVFVAAEGVFYNSSAGTTSGPFGAPDIVDAHTPPTAKQMFFTSPGGDLYSVDLPNGFSGALPAGDQLREAVDLFAPAGSAVLVAKGQSIERISSAEGSLETPGPIAYLADYGANSEVVFAVKPAEGTPVTDVYGANTADGRVLPLVQDQEILGLTAATDRALLLTRNEQEVRLIECKTGAPCTCHPVTTQAQMGPPTNPPQIARLTPRGGMVVAYQNFVAHYEVP